MGSKLNENLGLTYNTESWMGNRGGAALSIKAVTGKPIKFAGMGRKDVDLGPSS